MRHVTLALLMLAAGPAAAQEPPPSGFRIRIGTIADDDVADPLMEGLVDEEAEAKDEKKGGEESGEQSGEKAAEPPTGAAPALPGEPMAPAEGTATAATEADASPEATPAKDAAPAEKKKARSRRARKSRRWGPVDTVTPLQAARQAEGTPGSVIEFARSLSFVHDKTKLTADSAPALDEVVDYLQATPELRLVLVEGHTDASGSLRYNQKLSEARASAVRKALIDRGVAPERLVAYGYGETRPATADAAPNRRVVFRIIEGDRLALVKRTGTEWGQAAVVGLWGSAEMAPTPESNVDAAPGPMPAAEPTAEGETEPKPAGTRLAIRSDRSPAAEPETPAVADRTPPALPDDALSWQGLQMRAQLDEGLDVRTGPDGSVLLRLPDLTRLWLGADTRIRLSKVYYDHATGKAYTAVRLRRGTMRVMINPLERKASRTLVALPGGAIEAVATDFEVQTDSAGLGRLRIERGSVDVSTGAARSRAVYAGQALRLGMAGAAPRSQPSPPDIVAPLTGRFARAPALEWRAVPEATGYLVEVSADVDFYQRVMQTRVHTPRFQPEALDPDRRYYWRVRTVDRAGHVGAASPIHAFSTAPADTAAPSRLGFR